MPSLLLSQEMKVSLRVLFDLAFAVSALMSRRLLRHVTGEASRRGTSSSSSRPMRNGHVRLECLEVALSYVSLLSSCLGSPHSGDPGGRAARVRPVWRLSHSIPMPNHACRSPRRFIALLWNVARRVRTGGGRLGHRDFARRGAFGDAFPSR